MAWISVHEHVLGGKLRSLAKELKCSQNEALGLLVRLWLWGINNNANPDGKLESADKDDIAAVLNVGIDIKCDPKNAVEAMITTGWLDFYDDGYLYIHDWEDWQKQWYKAMKVREADNERKAKERERRRAQKGAASLPAPKPPSEANTPSNDAREPNPTSEPEQKPKTEYTKDFEEFWTAYPRKIGKGDAYKCYMARLKDGWSPAELLEAATNYAAMTVKEHTEQKYIKHPKTFLSASTPFADYIQKKGTGHQAQSDAGEDLDAMYAEWRK